MLAGKAKPELSRERLSLRLALTAVDQRDREEAIHQIRHFLELANGADREKGEAGGGLIQMRAFAVPLARPGIAELIDVTSERAHLEECVRDNAQHREYERQRYDCEECVHRPPFAS
jgi:hypothetical protein